MSTRIGRLCAAVSPWGPISSADILHDFIGLKPPVTCGEQRRMSALPQRRLRAGRRLDGSEQRHDAVGPARRAGQCSEAGTWTSPPVDQNPPSAAPAWMMTAALSTASTGAARGSAPGSISTSTAVAGREAGAGGYAPQPGWRRWRQLAESASCPEQVVDDADDLADRPVASCTSCSRRTRRRRRPCCPAATSAVSRAEHRAGIERRSRPGPGQSSALPTATCWLLRARRGDTDHQCDGARRREHAVAAASPMMSSASAQRARRRCR